MINTKKGEREGRQPIAFAFSASKSCWVIVPASSRAFAWLICSAGLLVAATPRM